ncbi:MAG: carbamoyl phosphate synthase small subunit [Streptococcaceae bacterium]|nr:carbamoyl phosphate synthase small subunit [Streptococcaceae bacterium]
MTKRILLLEDGTIFEGEALGARGNVTGELVFTSRAVGYQEAITNQSYQGQILMFTYPVIGNVGINSDDYESIYPSVKGVIVSDTVRHPSHPDSQINLDEFLCDKNIIGISGIDTDALMAIIEEKGTMKASIVSDEDEPEHLKSQLVATVLSTRQVESISTEKAYALPNSGYKIILIDFGLKHSILRELSKKEASVIVVPFDTSAETILSMSPEGVILSTGPGNPEDLDVKVLNTIAEIQTQVPVFAIGLGHQLFALANGARIEKMALGHRGFEHPIQEVATGRVEFAQQNHAYQVDREDFPEDLLVTHQELNDESIEGLRHKSYPAFSVQFYPESLSGQSDLNYLYDDFMAMIDEFIETKN